MGAANTKEAQPTTSSQSTNDDRDVPGVELRENKLKWQNAANYADTIRLNRSFLCGETRSTVYHCGPVFSETLPLDSRSYKKKPELIEDDGKSFWYGTKQRAYLKFLVPRLGGSISSASLQTFCDLLMQHPSVVTHILGDFTGRTPRSPPAKIRSNTAEKRYPLTLERTASTADELEQAECDVFTGIPGWIEEA
ncbi:hypothetical protein IMSHALPRED_011054 [Imshaugia aleurites]|uniref:Uncharacterized protein n=1 Tax=Imshaugia aleurites TaxID=172621 RepID=A0A8H3G602_9LECA|nr:hypothetical protein IMSHALPRED_011054 [Imshaugia aleurites]